MYRVSFIFILGLYSCSAVIYHLNETEYQRMPPLFALDEYDTCLSEEGGVYCFMQLTLHADPGNELMRMITEYSNYQIKHYNYSHIDRGICVKKTCQNYVSNMDSKEDLTSSLGACLNDSLWREYGLYAIDPKVHYCDLHDEPVSINLLDWIVLAVILGFVIMNIIGSLHDYFVCMGNDKKKEVGNGYLLSFSVMRNWKWLISTECNEPKTRDLQSLHGVRVISNVCMIMAHSMFLITSGFTSNPQEFEKTYDLPFYQMIYSGLMIVQIFFFVSGFLTVYYLQIEEQTRALTAWDIPKFVALRLFRLMPALLITLALSLTWVRHIGSGPLWKLFVHGTLVADCHKYWWQMLLFVHNYIPGNKYCLPHVWHLAADVQVFLVGITAYILTSGRLRYYLLGSLLLLSSAAPAIHTVLLDLDAIPILSPQSYRTFENPTLRFQHIIGHNNLPCFIIGMATGSIYYVWQKNDLKNRKLFNFLLYLSAASFPLIFYSGHVFYDYERPSLLVRAMYSSAVRPVFGILCVLAVPGMVMPTSSFIRSIFEWRYWLIPSRLTYCVYLLHIVLVHIILGFRKQLTEVSYLNVFGSHFIITVLSYIIAIPMYLMVEAPCTRAFNTLIGKRTLTSSKANGENKKKN